MVLRWLIHFIVNSKLLKAIVGDNILLSILYFRGANVYVSIKLWALAYFYKLCLYVGAFLFPIPAKFRFMFRAIYCLHVNDKCEDALTQLRLASQKGMTSIDEVILQLIQLEFLASTSSSSRNSIALLNFADALYFNEHIKMNLVKNYLLQDQIQDACNLLLEAVKVNKNYAISHQNFAARYDQDSNLNLQELDFAGDVNCHLYDVYHRLGQELINIGNTADGLLMFGRAMTLQTQLANRYFIPERLLGELADLPNFDKSKAIRIVPYEWVTQIGHMGMLDALIKMSRLGMRPDVNWVLLAPKDKVVNAEYLNCWNEYFVIVKDSVIAAKLLSYQRICGEQFNCYVEPDGKVIDWSDAASRAFREWDSRQWGPLVKVSDATLGYGQRKLAALGMPYGAWFVTLHSRASGFYSEGFGFIQKHRNARLKSYIPSVEAITRAGGWVIRMGDSSMPKMPVMQNVIDVAHSPFKSKKLDVYLWSQCRFFIGTTSGPTNAAISFHTPALLVNCVSNYAQSWNNRVIFMLKPFWSVRLKRFMKYSEVFTPEHRAAMFNGKSMSRIGICPISNTSEDLLEATLEMLDCVDSIQRSHTPKSPTLSNSGVPMWLWGNAIPSQSYLANHPELIN